jgi:CxxC motif-containing protein (DUF1111 family)
MKLVAKRTPPRLAALWLATLISTWADQSFRAVDPGVRGGEACAGTAMAGVDAQYFANTRAAFREVHSIAGDIEPGAGLGPRFNGTSCGACHAWPTTGGSSPNRNPQLQMAIAHGARNKIPGFIRVDGPVLAVRVRGSQGETLPLFTVNGRVDAYTCAVDTLDFTDRSNLSFRIPTPVFGAGLIDNILDAGILANRASHAVDKRKLGISDDSNIDSAGAVGKFGWKAQHHSLHAFAGEAYLTEMGVTNEASSYRREHLSTPCYALYEAAYDDPNFSPSYDGRAGSSLMLFTEFMHFLKPPEAVKEFAGATSESIRRGRKVFDRVGCALCHTPTLHTGNESDLPALNGQEVQLYSDLLLHHMGSKLTDGIVQGRAGPDQFRTAPLWGLGQRIFFLHDGRTTDLLVAIQEHASVGKEVYSEGNAVVERFNQMTQIEQQELLNFLRSL